VVVGFVVVAVVDAGLVVDVFVAGAVLDVAGWLVVGVVVGRTVIVVVRSGSDSVIVIASCPEEPVAGGTSCAATKPASPSDASGTSSMRLISPSTARRSEMPNAWQRSCKGAVKQGAERNPRALSGVYYTGGGSTQGRR
jgi:hypothetical protein